MDIFGYSSVSELQSFRPLATRLRGLISPESIATEKRKKNNRKFEFRLNCKQPLMFHQGPISDNTFMSVDAAQFCLCKSPINCLLSMNKSARRCLFCTVSKESIFLSRVKGRGSHVEGRGSRVEGRGSRVEGRGSRVICFFFCFFVFWGGAGFFFLILCCGLDFHRSVESDLHVPPRFG